jgi:hypothetical protein
MIVGDDAHNPYEIPSFLEMILASWRCWPQLFHPHVEDENAHVEDKKIIFPLIDVSETAPCNQYTQI